MGSKSGTQRPSSQVASDGGERIRAIVAWKELAGTFEGRLGCSVDGGKK